MSEVINTPEVEVDPLADKILTLKFSVKDVNAILNLLGNELPFVKVAGLINAIQIQCASQIETLNANVEAPIEPQAAA